jgi:Bacterial toxin homologue of phage lysozyme, C-term
VEAGQDFSNGQDLAGIISLAQAVSAGILGGTGGTTPLGTTPTAPPPPLQVAAQVISVAAEGVGGVYGTVKSARNGNGVGILAGALEAAAAAAAGIGMLPGTQTQTLNTISTALGAASVATNMGSDFANGNLAQGLVDSLNLYLPALALANANASSDNNITTANDATSNMFILASWSEQPTGIDFKIITENEGGVQTSGYVPPSGGAGVDHSGMTIGAGIDIGNQSVSGLQNLVRNYGLSADLVQKLAPYVGISGQPALTFLQANPIILSAAEVTNLDEAFWAYKGATLAAQFDSAQHIGLTFSMLPSNTQTALADMYWHYANLANGYLTKTQLWTEITTGNWSAAANNIATWTPVPIARNQAMGNLITQDLKAGLMPTPGH